MNIAPFAACGPSAAIPYTDASWLIAGAEAHKYVHSAAQIDKLSLHNHAARGNPKPAHRTLLPHCA